MAHVKLYCTQIISQLIYITWDTFLITECLQYTVTAALGNRDVSPLLLDASLMSSNSPTELH